jgi:hypothetical protein
MGNPILALGLSLDLARLDSRIKGFRQFVALAQEINRRIEQPPRALAAHFCPNR